MLVLAALLTVAAAFLPNARAGIFLGYDGWFHMARIESLATALQNGIFPVKVHPSLNFMYGYGVGFFYPDFFLYFPAALMVLGVSVTMAYKIFLLLLLTALFAGTYAVLCRLTESRAAALCGAVALTLSMNLFWNIYHILSLGIITAYVFVPLALGGFCLCVQGKKGAAFLGIGLAGALLSHSTTFLLLCTALVLLSFLHMRTIFSVRGLLCRLLLTVGAVVAVTAGYWLPALEQFGKQRFKVSAAPLIQIGGQVGTAGKFVFEQFGLCMTVLLLLSWGIWGYGKARRERQSLLFSLLLTDTLLNILVFFRPFWELTGDTFNFLQFPWRIVQVTTPLTALAFAVAAGSLARAVGGAGRENLRLRRMLWLAAAGIFVFSSASSYRFVWTDLIAAREKLDGRVIAQEIRGTSSGEEWLPAECSGSHFDQPDTAIDETGSGAQGEKLRGGSVFSAYVDLGKTYYTAPFVYYYGYRAFLENEDGTRRELRTDKSDYDGQLRVWMPEEEAGVGKITVGYQKTTLQKISYGISAAAAAGIAAVWLVNRQKKRSEAMAEKRKAKEA